MVNGKPVRNKQINQVSVITCVEQPVKGSLLFKKSFRAQWSLTND